MRRMRRFLFSFQVLLLLIWWLLGHFFPTQYGFLIIYVHRNECPYTWIQSRRFACRTYQTNKNIYDVHVSHSFTFHILDGYKLDKWTIFSNISMYPNIFYVIFRVRVCVCFVSFSIASFNFDLCRHSTVIFLLSLVC